MQTYYALIKFVFQNILFHSKFQTHIFKINELVQIILLLAKVLEKKNVVNLMKIDELIRKNSETKVN